MQAFSVIKKTAITLPTHPDLRGIFSSSISVKSKNPGPPDLLLDKLSFVWLPAISLICPFHHAFLTFFQMNTLVIKDLSHNGMICYPISITLLIQSNCEMH